MTSSENPISGNHLLPADIVEGSLCIIFISCIFAYVSRQIRMTKQKEGGTHWEN